MSNRGIKREFLADPDVTLYHGDVLAVLRELPAESVDCCVTSPPYWGLRDYGTGAWEGGDEGCDHQADVRFRDSSGIRDTSKANVEREQEGKGTPYRDICGKCGATRIDQQLGLEPTPEEYVTRMVEVFREVRRVLAAHGTVWLNLGDSYAGGGQTQPQMKDELPPSLADGPKDGMHGELYTKARAGNMRVPGLKPKDLVGIPWRVAFALQADGWYLRSAITWCKPNCMPESVTDRPTKATEMVFLLTKKARYYYDAESLREEAKWERWGDQTVVKPQPGTASWIGNKTKADLLAAHAAGGTNGTAPSAPTLRPELRATVRTDDGTTDAWGWCDLGETEIAIPASMADEAQRLQILNPVRLNVGVETAEGPLVVNLEGAGFSAADTPIPVSLASQLALLSPVWASVVDASPTPSGAVLADHVGGDPTPAALARAEVTALELTRVAGEWLAAEVTLKSEELSATLLVWGTARASHQRNITAPSGRNARDWWVIPTQPFAQAHFATFPEELARRAILAGTPESVCRVCGKARERVVERGDLVAAQPRGEHGYDLAKRDATGLSRASNLARDGVMPGRAYERTMAGFTDCGHSDYRPCTVLDPFMGSGTVAYVARKLGRRSIGIDLNESYLELAARRLQQQSLFAEAAS